MSKFLGPEGETIDALRLPKILCDADIAPVLNSIGHVGGWSTHKSKYNDELYLSLFNGSRCPAFLSGGGWVWVEESQLTRGLPNGRFLENYRLVEGEVE